jgi:hypothetical protein
MEFYTKPSPHQSGSSPFAFVLIFFCPLPPVFLFFLLSNGFSFLACSDLELTNYESTNLLYYG